MRRRGRLAALLTAVAVALLSGGPAVAAPSLPADSSAQGSIGLCTRAGRPMNSGKITDKPFVWRAVGSRAAPSPFDGKGTTATLYAFQPRPGVPADQWSGDTLTASSSYTNKAHPMAQATQLDFTLQDYLNEYPPKQDGLVQLRLIVGAVGVGAAPRYADAYLRVSGSTWTRVSGSSDFSCTDGTAVSSEVDAGIVDKSGNAIGTAAASLSASAAASSKSSSASGRGSGSASARPATSAPANPTASGPGASVAAPAAATSDASGSSSGGGGATLGIGLAVAVALAVGGVLVWRRRAPGRLVD